MVCCERVVIEHLLFVTVQQRNPCPHYWEAAIPLRDTGPEAHHPGREPVPAAPAATQRSVPSDWEASEANSRNSSTRSHAAGKTPVSSIRWCYIPESTSPRSVPDTRPAPPARLSFHTTPYSSFGYCLMPLTRYASREEVLRLRFSLTEKNRRRKPTSIRQTATADGARSGLTLRVGLWKSSGLRIDFV